jgi:hypothetical protein
MSANTSMNPVDSGDVTTGWVLLLIEKVVASTVAGVQSRFSTSRWGEKP